MTIAELDTLFPARRTECEKLGVDPERHFIPKACLFTMTDEQMDAIFPARKAVLKQIFQRVVEVVTAREEAYQSCAVTPNITNAPPNL